MTINLKDKAGRGIAPAAFISGMTKNQETFLGWYNAFSWTNPEDEAYFASALQGTSGLRCAIIAADWCGDVVRNVPVVLRVMEKAQIPTEIYIMEEHLDFIDAFLTFGGRSIPVVLILDENGTVRGKWGPRPSYVQEPMVSFKTHYEDKNHPEYQDKMRETYAEIHKRYGEGTAYQALIVEELKGLFASM
jgi:hypothetical protein